ncbi:tyrosine-type recombinase/integrase [Acinetobacter stercoris]|uniref:Putative prophage CPS-53 integrase n=1 Tax=Acinetobacter stercoris TaxID=2126983 RepID=A0A2U3N4A6_9GAMM|nr:integrase arm-type DNA-binding domain-containing protein [Acinetobacter stercoris]SPL72464.1 putative prophage CPS-53 integrase [Acinetobacter stercoris]
MLTDTKIKSLKPRDKIYRVADHNGLCIEIRHNGTKLWRYRYRFNGKASMLSLGEYPLVGLADARKARDQAKLLIEDGINPAQNRRQEKIEAQLLNANTFKLVANEYIYEILSNRSNGYISKFKKSLEIDIFPIIGEKNVKDITSADVLFIIKSTVSRVRKTGIRGTGEVTAMNNQKIIGAVIRYAIATLRAENDPTYAVRGAVVRPEIEHARPLTKDEQKLFRCGLDEFRGSNTVRNALLTMAYTMLRSIEVRRMKWRYVDFDEKIITFPISTRNNNQERTTKKNRIHLVPMSDQLFDLLKTQFIESGNKEFIFPAVYKTSSDGIGNATLNVALKNMGLKTVTAHDFRATASTILNEQDFDENWIEKQLAHVDQNKTRASYNHAKYMDQRRDMLQQWANIVDSWKDL